MIPKRKGKFALIGHPPDMDVFRSYVRHLKPDREFKDELLLKLFEWTPSYKVKDLVDCTFDGERFADGVIIMVPFLPEMRDIRLRTVTQKIEQSIAIAAEQGCEVAALGAFNSIILQGREQELSEKYSIRLTSGNTLTAALIIRSIESLATEYALDLSKATIGVIGASGDIGSICTRYFAPHAGKMILTARGLSGLETLAAGIDEAGCEIETTTDNQKAVAQAQILILVTSAHASLFTMADFKPGTVVCDASAPVNVQFKNDLRDDVLVYHGGIAELPFPVDFGFDVGLPGPRFLYGCMTEGIVAAIDPAVPCSWGRGEIDLQSVKNFMAMVDAQVRPAFTIGSDYRYSASQMEVCCAAASKRIISEAVYKDT